MDNAARFGFLVIISSPSGGGKTTLAQQVLKRLPGLTRSISHTTRPPRPGEINGRDYFFVDQPQFDSLATQGKFLEHANVFGQQYGTNAAFVHKELTNGLDILLQIDGQGARHIRKHWKAQKDLGSVTSSPVTIFVLPPSLQILKERLLKRGDAPEVVDERMRQAEQQISYYNEYDYVIMNDSLHTAVSQVIAIIQAERCCAQRYSGRFRKLALQAARL